MSPLDGRVVKVLDGGTSTTFEVEIRTIGATWTEVRSGLEEGATVVADLDEPPPGLATDSATAPLARPGPSVVAGSQHRWPTSHP